MKVLFIIQKPIWDLNGISIYVKKLALSLLNMNIQFDILTFSDKIIKPNKRYFKDILIYIYPTKSVLNSFIRRYRSARFYTFYYTIHFLLKYGYRYDIIHTHSFMVTHSLYSIILSKFCKFKSVLTVHGDIWEKKNYAFLKTLKLGSILERIFNFWMGKIQFTIADALIFVSKLQLLKINKKYLSKRKTNIYFVPNGVKIKNSNKNLAKQSQRKFITFIGALHPIKGFDIFLEIIERINKRIPSIPICIVGKNFNQEYYNKMIELKKNLNISYFEKLYPLSPIYHKTKILVNTSRSEGAPTTILEAINNNIPILASNIDANLEIINDGVNGFLFNLNNIQEAVDKIEILYKNQKIVDKFTNNSKILLRKYYDWDKIVLKIIKIYKNTISG